METIRNRWVLTFKHHIKTAASSTGRGTFTLDALGVHRCAWIQWLESNAAYLWGAGTRLSLRSFPIQFILQFKKALAKFMGAEAMLEPLDAGDTTSSLTADHRQEGKDHWESTFRLAICMCFRHRAVNTSSVCTCNNDYITHVLLSLRLL